MAEAKKRRSTAFLNDKIHKDLYDKVNANTNAVASLNASVGVLTAQNERFIEIIEHDTANLTRIFKWVVAMLFVLILFLVAALAYGAIGDKGLHSVRKNMPTVPSVTYRFDILPWHDDKQLFVEEVPTVA